MNELLRQRQKPAIIVKLRYNRTHWFSCSDRRKNKKAIGLIQCNTCSASFELLYVKVTVATDDKQMELADFIARSSKTVSTVPSMLSSINLPKGEDQSEIRNSSIPVHSIHYSVSW